MIASARLSKMPKIRPCAHDGTGSRAAPITKPIAKRLRNAAVNAAVLSANGSGIIEPADRNAINETANRTMEKWRHHSLP